MDEAIRLLLQVAMIVSPTSKEQEGFSTMVQDMRGVGESPLTITGALVDAISDGLKHGNWPNP